MTPITGSLTPALWAEACGKRNGRLIYLMDTDRQQRVHTDSMPAVQGSPSAEDASATVGVIDVGGGFRSIFGTGVLDACLEHNIHFDRCYGVSAGSADMASYLSGQYRRNLRFYTEYSFRSQYASFHNMLSQRDFINLDYIYSGLSNHDGEYPLDYEALRDNPATLTVVACNANTGEPHYFTKDDISQDNYDIFKASSCVPAANAPYIINGVPYFEGGIADPVPVEKAFEDGCTKVVLILTRQKDVPREPAHDRIPGRLLKRQYPAAAERVLNRYKLYNSQISLAEQYEEKGEVLILAPDDLHGLDTLKKTRQGLFDMYDDGLKQIAQIQEFIR